MCCNSTRQSRLAAVADFVIFCEQIVSLLRRREARPSAVFRRKNFGIKSNTWNQDHRFRRRFPTGRDRNRWRRLCGGGCRARRLAFCWCWSFELHGDVVVLVLLSIVVPESVVECFQINFDWFTVFVRLPQDTLTSSRYKDGWDQKPSFR